MLTPTAPAQFNPIGSGCGPVSGLAPALTCTQLPYIGNVLGLRLQNLPTSGSPFAVLLFDGALLPAPIQVCANCLVQVQASISLAVINTFGIANWQAPLPHLPQFLGASLYVQGATVNAGYPCLPGVGLGLSNAGQLVIGSY
jgi:hypothetical protein